MSSVEAPKTTRSSDLTDLVAQRRAAGQPVRLELGCGETKEDPTAIGLDLRDAPGVDVVGDALAELGKLPSGCVDEISSSHFLEHVADLEATLAQSARVLRSGGRFIATVPHFSNPYYYSDPTHRQPFGLYTFNYLVAETFTRRQVPHYDEPAPFHYLDATFIFKSWRPNYLRHGLKQIGRIFNASRWTKEWFEESWCWRMPAYEIRCTLERA